MFWNIQYGLLEMSILKCNIWYIKTIWNFIKRLILLKDSETCAIIFLHFWFIGMTLIYQSHHFVYIEKKSNQRSSTWISEYNKCTIWRYTASNTKKESYRHIEVQIFPWIGKSNIRNFFVVAFSIGDFSECIFNAEGLHSLSQIFIF